jgi:hypothetical protein
MKGEFREIDKHLLRIDPNYQRPELHGPKQKKIRVNWNWELCGTLLVGERSSGELYVIDGQQRLRAAMANEEVDMLPCMVYKSDGPRHEAQIFMDSAVDRQGLGPHDIHKARIAGGNKPALDINRVVTERGFVFSPSTGPRTIDCVGTVFRDYMHRGQPHPHVLEALRACMEVAGGKYQIKVDLFVGMECIFRNKVALDAVAMRKLMEATWEDISGEIRKFKVANGTDGGRSQAMGILKVANYRRPLKNHIRLPGVA